MRSVCFAMVVALLFVFVFLGGAAALAQGVPQELPKLAVYVTGNAAEEQKKVFTTRMLVALVNIGRYAAVERQADFAGAVEARRADSQSAAEGERGIYAVGKAFGAKFVCITDITATSDGEYQILSRIVDVETAQVAAMGDFYGPIKTTAELKLVSNELLETMFGGGGASFAAPQPAPVSSAPTGAASAGAPSPVVSVTGEAKEAVDKVVAAVKAVKDAIAESVAATNAVTAAVQQKNFGAISQAKKKVESAVAAVKKAREDAAAAVEAVNAAGPDAVAAAKAMGIDLSMFAGGEEEEEEGPKSRWYFATKYYIPATEMIPDIGAINIEFGKSWKNGAFFGGELGFGLWDGDDGWRILVGGGISFGGALNLAESVQLLYGTSVGVWYLGASITTYYYNGYYNYNDHYTENYNGVSFGGPFVKFRVSVFELTYRALIGYEYNATYDTQLMVGFHFGGSKPKAPKAAKPAASAPASPPVVENPYLTDARNGQNYRTVKIGDKTWTADNLNYQTGNSRCYGGDDSYCAGYGRLYDWNTAKSACPAGWHLPTREEWGALAGSAGGSAAGKNLKSTAYWVNGGNGIDRYGFSALPGGYRYSDGNSLYAGSYGYWWTATEGDANTAYSLYLGHNYEGAGESLNGKNDGLSVRCVRD